MNVLIACEESQRVCTEFRKIGHNAFSCDIQEPSGGHPEWHILGDVLEVLNPKLVSRKHSCVHITSGEIRFETMDGTEHCVEGRWDLIIAHPPCTYLTVTGNRWFSVEKYGKRAIERAEKRKEAVDFFMKFVHADCERIAIENPVGYMSTEYCRPTQIIQPYEYGDPVSKKTCLWLFGLPKLQPTKKVAYSKDSKGHSGSAIHAVDENGKILGWNDPKTAKIRSKTFPGIAKAMAEQWGGDS